MTTTMEERKTILLRAKEIIRERGWIQGTLESVSGGVCLVGACNLATKEHHAGKDWDWLYESDPHQELELNRFFRANFGAVTAACWNDQPDRTKQDVLDVLDRMAAEWCTQ